jgi:hypothetical protein
MTGGTSPLHVWHPDHERRKSSLTAVALPLPLPLLYHTNRETHPKLSPLGKRKHSSSSSSSSTFSRRAHSAVSSVCKSEEVAHDLLGPSVFC